MLKVSYDLEGSSLFKIEIYSWAFETKMRFPKSRFPLTQILAYVLCTHKLENSALVNSSVHCSPTN